MEMEINGFVFVLLLLFTIFLCPSDAFSSRKLVEVSDTSNDSIGNQDSPLPPPDDNKPNISPDESTKTNNTLNTNPSNVESKGLNDTNSKAGSETSNDKIVDNGKSQDGEKKVENQKQSETSTNKRCKGNPVCSDQKKNHDCMYSRF
ncbi:uncharacterized protein [Rutidosis leptorrhynchoides]|uniref:uncharacterized protein n=1 Tax=Rutidosis leptorrhynchoides TaxID=125765 RepID=UPI003A9A1CA7